MQSGKPLVSKQEAEKANEAIEHLEQLVNNPSNTARSIWALPCTWFAIPTKVTVKENAQPINPNLPFSRRSSIG